MWMNSTSRASYAAWWCRVHIYSSTIETVWTYYTRECDFDHLLPYMLFGVKIKRSIVFT